MPTGFDTPFDRWMRAHGVRPLRLSQKAELSRPTILRMRKGSLGSPRTRAKLIAACSAISRRPVAESDLFREPRGTRRQRDLLQLCTAPRRR